MNKTQFTIEPGKQELFITRVFDAPRELVFKAHTDPEWLVQWMGPSRLTMVVEALDVRPGGWWRFVHQDQEGSAFGFHGVHHDVVYPQRIVRTFEFEGAPGQVQLETLTLEDLGSKTKLIAHAV